MKIESDHLAAQSALLLQIRDLIHAQGQRVIPDMQPFNFASSGVFELVIEGQPGQRLFIGGYVIVADSAVTATWGSSDGTTFKRFTGPAEAAHFPGELSLADNGGVSAWLPYPQWVMRTEPSQGLALQLSTEVAVGGHGVYWKA